MKKTQNKVSLEEGKVKYSEIKMQIARSVHLMSLHYKPMYYVQASFFITV